MFNYSRSNPYFPLKRLPARLQAVLICPRSEEPIARFEIENVTAGLFVFINQRAQHVARFVQHLQPQGACLHHGVFDLHRAGQCRVRVVAKQRALVVVAK